MSILFITSSGDHAVNAVTAWLDKMKERYVRINTEDFLKGKKLALSLTSEGAIELIFDKISVNLESTTSICYRHPSFFIKEQNADSEFIIAQWKHAIWSFCTSCENYWVNNPLWGKNLLEHNKLYQLQCALFVGLMVPETIISNDNSEITDFSKKQNGIVACKPLRQTNLVNEHDKPVGIYTQMVRTEQFEGREGSISVSPFIVQQYIPKHVELRITVIGKHIFTCEIHSQDSEKTKHDWRRYDFDNVKHLKHDLPSDISEKILALMLKLRLNYGAIDMILTPSGDYYFLEINPAGQYGWIEDIVGFPISETYANALLNPESNGIIRHLI